MARCCCRKSFLREHWNNNVAKRVEQRLARKVEWESHRMQDERDFNKWLADEDRIEAEAATQKHTDVQIGLDSNSGSI